MQRLLTYSHSIRLFLYFRGMDCLWCVCGLIIVLVLMCHARVIDVSLHVYFGGMDCLWCVCGLILVLVLMYHAMVIDLFSLKSIACIFRGYGLFVVCLWVVARSGVGVPCNGH